MSPLDWFKKEKPLQSMQSMGGGAVGGVMAGGVSEGGPYSISGGTMTTPGNGYKYFDIKNTNPAPERQLAITVDGAPGYITFSFVAVGGGGAGGQGAPEFGSGGGGAGAFVQLMDYTDIILDGPDTWPVSIGEGGLANGRTGPQGRPANPSPGGPYKGNDTTITIPSPKSPLTITAYGGAGGLRAPTNPDPLGNYGSGGGAPQGSGPPSTSLNGIVQATGVPTTIDGSGNTPLSGIGFDGGQGQRTGQYNSHIGGAGGSGGGGGGAGSVGKNATTPNSGPNGGGPPPTSGGGAVGPTNPKAKGGAGGDGRVIFNSDPGFPLTLAGGGGGGQGDGGPWYQGGPGGPGGGGGGGSAANPSPPTASPGTDHTGGGGGGAGGMFSVNPAYSGAGGPGRVIFRVPVSIIT